MQADTCDDREGGKQLTGKCVLKKYGWLWGQWLGGEWIIKYKKNVVKHNLFNDFIKVYSYIVSSNDMFRLWLWAIFRWLITWAETCRWKKHCKNTP
jgi:hypothetical protein